MKKFIALISAATMLATSAITANALTIVQGNKATFPLEDYVGMSIPKGNYSISGYTDVKYEIRPNDSGSRVELTNGEHSSNGKRALKLYGNDKSQGNSNGSAGVSLLFDNQKTSDKKYVISFDAYRPNKDWRDYAALCCSGWDGAARLNGTTVWTVTSLGTGADIGGVGNGAWSRYSATLKTDIAPQLNFAVDGWGVMHIDNIIVKDTSGNLLYSEDFEGDAIQLVDGEHVISTGYDGWAFEGSSDVAIEVKDEADGTGKRLRVLGKTGSGNVGRWKIPLPAKSADGKYYISYDYTKTSDGASDGSVSIDLAGDNIFGAGCINKKNENGELVVSGSGDYLYIAGTQWCGVYIDNIVVKDGNGKVLFTEDFDNFDEKYSYKTYETKLHGLSANGRDGVIYLAWRNPVRNDIESIQIYENDEETFSGQLASISLESSHINIVEMTDDIYSGDGSIHTYDVRMITKGGEIFHNVVTGKEGTPFIFETKTSNGTPLQGWHLNYADGAEVLALGTIEYDTLNVAEGKTSLHINPNITYTSENQEIDSEKTTVRAEYSDGARINLDALIGGFEAGKTYKLSWKQKGHRASHYYVQLVMDNRAETIGSMTVNGEYVTTPWQNREIEFTLDSVGTLPAIRFEFSNGANDFWIDDVKLVEVGGTENLIANGSFEYGMSNLAINGKTATWTLADPTDSVDVYVKAGNTLVKKASLPAGATSYTEVDLQGTSVTYVFKTVKKSGNVEYQSEEYTAEMKQSSYISDAVLEVVELQDGEYVVVEQANAITAGALLRSSVRIDNATEENAVSADVWTILYKDGRVVSVDKNTPSAVKGATVNGGSIVSIPAALNDGVYELKVFVWNADDVTAIKDAKVLN